MQDVSRLLEGKVLVGHALHNDLDVLMMNHHRHMIRDTACYHPYMRVSAQSCCRHVPLVMWVSPCVSHSHTVARGAR